MRNICHCADQQEEHAKQRAQRGLQAAERSTSDAAADWRQPSSRALWGSVNQGFSWAVPADETSVTKSEYAWQSEELALMKEVRSCCTSGLANETAFAAHYSCLGTILLVI